MVKGYKVGALVLLIVPAIVGRSVEADRVTGVIMGATLGDALARVTTPLDTTQEMTYLYGKEGVTSVTKFAGDDWIVDEAQEKRAPYASNTVLSLLTLDVMAQGRSERKNKEAIANDLAEGLVNIFGEGYLTWDPHFDARYHTTPNLQKGEVLEERAQRKEGTPWWSQGNEDSAEGEELMHEADSGSLARVWPVGLVYSDQIASARYYTDYLTAMTHRHPTARAAASALVTGLAHALQGASINEMVDQMVLAAEKFDRIERQHKTSARKIWSRRHFSSALIAHDQMLTSDVIRYAARAAQEGVAPEEILGTNSKKQDNSRSYRGYLLGYQADEAVAAAVYLLVRNPHNFKALVAEGSLAGGNAALITSLAGALYGAQNGFAHFAESDFVQDINVLENKQVLLELSEKVNASFRSPGKLYTAGSTDKDFEESIEAYHYTVRGSGIFTLRNLFILGGLVLGGYLVKKYVWPQIARP